MGKKHRKKATLALAGVTVPEVTYHRASRPSECIRCVQIDASIIGLGSVDSRLGGINPASVNPNIRFMIGLLCLVHYIAGI